MSSVDNYISGKDEMGANSQTHTQSYGDKYKANLCMINTTFVKFHSTEAWKA